MSRLNSIQDAGMKIKHKPDFLLVLAIVVGVGVVLTMKVQPGTPAQLASHTTSVSAVVVSAAVK